MNLTPKWLLGWPAPTDQLADGDDTIKALAERADLLNGEKGIYTITALPANTTHSQAIVLSRTYTGDATSTTPGQVLLMLQAALVATTGFNWWVSGWTGTATTVTGFTLNVVFTTVQTRTIAWRFLPSA